MSNKEKFEIEEMSSFFNVRAEGYEDHMKETVNEFEKYYDTVSSTIEKTEEPIKILDLGCGTGLEIKGILEKAPNAIITCIDMTKNMTDILLENYKDYKGQINIINDSYINIDFEKNTYDYVVAVMTMHHFVYDEKIKLYKKIKKALKISGKYIEGDYYVTLEKEKELLELRDELLKENNAKCNESYHIDIPFALETQQRLLNQAQFNEFKLIWKKNEQAIYVTTQLINS